MICSKNSQPEQQQPQQQRTLNAKCCCKRQRMVARKYGMLFVAVASCHSPVASCQLPAANCQLANCNLVFISMISCPAMPHTQIVDAWHLGQPRVGQGQGLRLSVDAI